MAALIALTAEEINRIPQDTPETVHIDPDNIKIVLPEFFDWTADRGYVEYYDNQHKSMVQLMCSEDPVAIKALANAQLTALTFINSIDSMPVHKLGYLQLHDSQVRETDNEPFLLVYNFGERNHADHKNLQRCDYPLNVVDADMSSLNSITVNCCVADTFVAGVSIAITGGSNAGNYTVVSSACSTDDTQTVIILEEALSANGEGGTVAIT